MKNKKDLLTGVIVTSLKESKSGDIEVTVEYNEEFVEVYKQETGMRRAHKKSVAAFLRKTVEENIQNVKKLASK